MTSFVSIKGGITDYILNGIKTMTKLKQAARRIDMDINNNPNGSKTILLSTGAYMNVILPLVRDGRQYGDPGGQCRTHN